MTVQKVGIQLNGVWPTTLWTPVIVLVRAEFGMALDCLHVGNDHTDMIWRPRLFGFGLSSVLVCNHTVFSYLRLEATRYFFHFIHRMLATHENDETLYIYVLIIISLI